MAGKLFEARREHCDGNMTGILDRNKIVEIDKGNYTVTDKF